MMEILLSTHQNLIPLQRTQMPKFLENFYLQGRVQTNFAKTLALMNRILTIPGNNFTYQTILSLVSKLAKLGFNFKEKHIIFRDEFKANQWIKSELGLDNPVPKQFDIMIKPVTIRNPQKAFETDLNLDAEELMMEMQQLMESQEEDIKRVIGVRKEQSDQTEKERKTYIEEKKKKEG